MTVRIITVHGTSDYEESLDRPKWWQSDFRFSGKPFDGAMPSSFPVSNFVSILYGRFGGPSECHVESFKWSGEYSELERRKAGKALAATLKDALAHDDQSEFILVGHSHGGSVIDYALRFGTFNAAERERIRSWHTIGTPFLHFRRPIGIGRFGKYSLPLVGIIVVLLTYLNFFGYLIVNCKSEDFMASRHISTDAGKANTANKGAAGANEPSIEEAVQSFRDETVGFCNMLSDEMISIKISGHKAQEAKVVEANGPDLIADYGAYAQRDNNGDIPENFRADGQTLIPSQNYTQVTSPVAMGAASREKLEQEMKNNMDQWRRTSRDWFTRTNIILGSLIGLIMLLNGRSVWSLYWRPYALNYRKNFQEKWFGVASRNDEAVSGLAAGGVQISQMNEVIPRQFIQLFIFIFLVVIFTGLVFFLGAGIPGLQMLHALLDNTDTNRFLQDLSENVPLDHILGGGESLRDGLIPALDIVIDAAIAFAIIFVFASGLSQIRKPDIIGSFGDDRIIRSLRAILLGTAGLRGESVKRVDVMPSGFRRAQVSILPDDLHSSQKAHVDAHSPQTLALIRDELGIYGQGLAEGFHELPARIARLFKWDELYHTTYFRVPEVSNYIADQVAENAQLRGLGG